MKASDTAPILKRFLYEKIGFKNINNGIVSVVDDYTLAFKINEMAFMLDCDTMTVLRVTGNVDGKTAVSYSHVDQIAGIVERGIKEYICNFIESLEKQMSKTKSHTWGGNSDE